MTDPLPFNPLDKKNLAASVGEALLERAPVQLGNAGSFSGAGIYAIYYVGDFEAYRQLAEENRDDLWNSPIYVGKAIPSGGRKGGEQSTSSESKSLRSRLKEHADSIRAAGNLNIDDFWCRYLVVDDIWIPLGENLMISKFSPIWNAIVDGFGNHTPGAGRFQQMRSRWDVLHPGRDWAAKCKERPEPVETIISEVKAHLRARPKVSPKLFRT